MLKSQSLLLEQSTAREKVNAFLAMEDGQLTTEQRSEMGSLTQRLQNLEGEYRAALTIEGDKLETRSTEDAESREMRELIAGASIGEVVTATLQKRSTDGKTAELQTHLGLTGNQIPLAMLTSDPPLEIRTTGVTPAPADVNQNQSEIIPAVFPSSVAAFLSIPSPVIPTGDHIFPVLTTSAEVRTPAEGADAAHTVGAFSSEVLTPKRLQAEFFYSREDRARFVGMDDALKQNLEAALADGLDKEVISGTNGLLTGNQPAQSQRHQPRRRTHSIEASSHTVASTGRTPARPPELRAVMGTETYAPRSYTISAGNNDTHYALAWISWT